MEKKNVAKIRDYKKLKINQKQRELDPLLPDRCIRCRFLVYERTLHPDGFCLIWHEDQDFGDIACTCGVKQPAFIFEK